MGGLRRRLAKIVQLSALGGFLFVPSLGPQHETYWLQVIDTSFCSLHFSLATSSDWYSITRSQDVSLEILGT